MKYFLVMWDCNGLETLQDISEFHPDNWDKNQLLGVMMGKAYKKAPIHAQISQMVLRAKFNPQRNYEIYIQQAAAEITAGDFAKSFNLNPQFWADYIREHHSVKIYSDRVKKGSRVIE
jgi:hypothetical protein